MTTAAKRKIIDELNEIPETFISDILEFIHYLKFKQGVVMAKEDAILTALASEKSLSKDWLKKEEEEAWKNL